MTAKEIEELGRSLALYQERLRLPSLSKEDAMILAGRKSSSSWYRFCAEHGIKRLKNGRISRRQLDEALRKESKGA